MNPAPRIRPQAILFCRVDQCQNVLPERATGFCHDPHRALYHKTARLVGHGVIRAAGYQEAQEFRRQCESYTRSAKGEQRLRIKIQRTRPEEYDLDSMPPQERLGMLCRAAERVGVI